MARGRRAKIGRMQIGTPGPAVSRIAQAYPDRVEVRGRDLTGDLMERHCSWSEFKDK